MTGTCHRCGTAIAATDRIGRREACPSCGAELHCCRNCRFHDPGMHNQCREPQAERQVDKERANFCEYFAIGAPAAGSGADGGARAKLEQLFRGKRPT
jgi:hypothetical protein